VDAGKAPVPDEEDARGDAPSGGGERGGGAQTEPETSMAIDLIMESMVGRGARR